MIRSFNKTITIIADKLTIKTEKDHYWDNHAQQFVKNIAISNFSLKMKNCFTILIM